MNGFGRHGRARRRGERLTERLLAAGLMLIASASAGQQRAPQRPSVATGEAGHGAAEVPDVVGYAAVSVSAQELLFSSFFFWRYRNLAPPPCLDALNVVAFGIAHLVYGSWVSVGLSMLGRLVLVRVYRRHGSLWGVWLLHLAFGTLVFLVGLGPYFYRPLAAAARAPMTGR